MTEILTPPQISYEVIDQIFQETIDELPLDDRTVERNPFNNDLLEFSAPDGMAFRLTGDFYKDTHGEYPPILSESMAQKLESGGEFEVDEHTIFVTEFIGSRLSISLGEYQEIIYGGAYNFRAKPSDDLSPRVHILTPLEFDATFAVTSEFTWEERPGSGIFHHEKIFDECGKIVYGSESAFGKLNDVKVELVPHDFPVPEFEPIVKKYNKKLEPVTAPSAPTSHQMAEYYRAAGMNVSEEDRIADMRHRRLKGMPLGDDPLRDVMLIQADENGKLPLIGSLLDMIEKEKIYRGAKSSAELAELDKRRTVEESVKMREKLLTTRLTIIRGLIGGSIDATVEKYAAPGWLDKELDSLRKDWDNNPVF